MRVELVAQQAQHYQQQQQTEAGVRACLGFWFKGRPFGPFHGLSWCVSLLLRWKGVHDRKLLMLMPVVVVVVVVALVPLLALGILPLQVLGMRSRKGESGQLVRRSCGSRESSSRGSGTMISCSCSSKSWTLCLWGVEVGRESLGQN
jgi:hypothetical protein